MYKKLLFKYSWSKAQQSWECGSSGSFNSVKCFQGMIVLMEFSWSLQTVSWSTDYCTKPGLLAHCAASFLHFLLQLFSFVLTSLFVSDFYASLALIGLSRKHYLEQSEGLTWTCCTKHWLHQIYFPWLDLINDFHFWLKLPFFQKAKSDVVSQQLPKWRTSSLRKSLDFLSVFNIRDLVYNAC